MDPINSQPACKSDHCAGQATACPAGLGEVSWQPHSKAARSTLVTVTISHTFARGGPSFLAPPVGWLPAQGPKGQEGSHRPLPLSCRWYLDRICCPTAALEGSLGGGCIWRGLWTRLIKLAGGYRTAVPSLWLWGTLAIQGTESASWAMGTSPPASPGGGGGAQFALCFPSPRD